MKWPARIKEGVSKEDLNLLLEERYDEWLEKKIPEAIEYVRSPMRDIERFIWRMRYNNSYYVRAYLTKTLPLKLGKKISSYIFWFRALYAKCFLFLYRIYQNFCRITTRAAGWIYRVITRKKEPGTWN